MNRKDVAPANGAAQFVQDAEPISCQIDSAIGSLELGLPCLWRKGCWWWAGALAAGMNHTEIINGLQQGPAGGSRAEIEAGEQSRRIGNLAIVLPEFGKVGVVVRFREGADTLDGRVKRLPVDQVEDCGADCIVGRFGIENDDRRVA